jgi:hypothetical protein
MRREQTQRVKALLDELDYDFSSFTLEGFADWLAQRRRRQIVFVPKSMPASISGAWVKGHDKDYIFYEMDTPIVHQAHIQLHEMAHMLCGHPTVEVGPQQTQALLRHTGRIDSQALEHLLQRSVHSGQAEEEAESLTLFVQERVFAHKRAEELYKTGHSEIFSPPWLRSVHRSWPTSPTLYMAVYRE